MTASNTQHNLSRRSVAKGIAWATPAVIAASAAPALAASPVKALCTKLTTHDTRFGVIGDGIHKGKTGVTLAGGTAMEPIYFEVRDQDSDLVKDAVITPSAALPEGVKLSPVGDGRWMLSGTPVNPTFDNVDRKTLGTEVRFKASSPRSPGVIDSCSPSLVFYVGGWDVNMNTAWMSFGGLGNEFWFNIINEGVAPTPAGMVFAASFNCRNVSGLATGKMLFTSAEPYNVKVLPYSDGNKFQGFPSVELTTGTVKTIFFELQNSIEPGGVVGINAGTTGVVVGNKLDFCVKWMNPSPSSQYEWPPSKGDVADRFGFWIDEQTPGWREKNKKIFFHSLGDTLGVDGFVAYDVAYAIRSWATVPEDSDKVLFYHEVPEWPNP